MLEGRELTLAVDLEEAWEESVHPLVWIGGGVAVASLAAAITLGVLSQQQLDVTDTQRANGDVLRADLVAFYDARGREAIAADVLFGLAGGAAITAVVSLFFPERRRAARAVALLPAPNGLLLEGSF